MSKTPPVTEVTVPVCRIDELIFDIMAILGKLRKDATDCAKCPFSEKCGELKLKEDVENLQPPSCANSSAC